MTNNILKLNTKALKASHIIMFSVLIVALILTNYFMNTGIQTQNKYIEYLVLLDMYGKVSDEHIEDAIKYIQYGDESALENYYYLANSNIRDEILEDLYALGITQLEQQKIHDALKICDQLRAIEIAAIEEHNSQTTEPNLLLEATTLIDEDSIRNIHTTDFMGSTYIDLIQQYKDIMLKLRDSVTNRMNAEITQKTSPINTRFFIMTLIALSVPIFAFNSFHKSPALNKRITEDRELQAATLANIADGVIVVDSKGTIVLFNPAAEKILNHTGSQAIGRNIDEILKFKDPSIDIRNCRYNSYSPAINCPLHMPIGKHLIIKTSYNQEKIVEIRCSRIADNKKVTGIVYTITDETEKKKMQEEMEKAKRLESLGLLAGGIAHDFNNTLTVIIGNIGLAKLYEFQKSTDKISHCLDEIAKETNRAQYITKQILTFARGGIPVKEITSLYEIIKEASDSVFKNTTVNYTIKAPLSDIKIDADFGQMLHAFRNIFTNSLESMENKEGNVSIEIIKSTTCEENEQIKVKITDDGAGIPENILPKIFDIYFTTKEGSQGIGLATTYKVISNHDGSIKAQSKEGETIFTVSLPLACKNKIRQNQNTNDPNTIETILIMDDEEGILTYVSNYLTEVGYTVKTTRCGEEAIKEYKEKLIQGKAYDLLILDLTVPSGLGGKEAMQEILKLDPKAKAIVASGYSHDPVMSNYQQYGFQGILPKPYKPEDLIKTIKKM